MGIKFYHLLSLVFEMVIYDFVFYRLMRSVINFISNVKTAFDAGINSASSRYVLPDSFR